MHKIPEQSDLNVLEVFMLQLQLIATDFKYFLGIICEFYDTLTNSLQRMKLFRASTAPYQRYLEYRTSFCLDINFRMSVLIVYQ